MTQAPAPRASAPRVSAIVLAWGDEPLLTTSVRAALASTGVEVEVVLVDNGCTSDAVEQLRAEPGVVVAEGQGNVGFAGGCNLGAERAGGDYLAFVNGDAVVEPAALARMVAVAAEPEVGLVTGSVRLYDAPQTINSAGNPLHYSGLSWAGGLGEPASSYAVRRDVTVASGAATVCRREVFEELGGFCELMFAYCEDTELSLRAWQHGWRVVYVPDAVVLHRYEFSRNDLKLYLLERNRLLMLLTVLQARTLLLLAPALLGLELAMLAVATKQGWGRRKRAGWWWLVRNAGAVRRRRRLVQESRLQPDAALVGLLTGDFAPGVEGLAAPSWLRAGSRAYWAVMRPVLRATTRERSDDRSVRVPSP